MESRLTIDFFPSPPSTPAALPAALGGLDARNKEKLLHRYALLPLVFMGRFALIKKQFEEGGYKKYFYLECPHLDLQKSIEMILSEDKNGNPFAHFDLQLLALLDLQPQFMQPVITSTNPVTIANVLMALLFNVWKNEEPSKRPAAFTAYKDLASMLLQVPEITKSLLLCEALLIKEKENALQLISSLGDGEEVREVRQFISSGGMMREKLRGIVKQFFENEKGGSPLPPQKFHIPKYFTDTTDSIRSSVEAELSAKQNEIALLADQPYSPEISQQVSNGFNDYRKLKKDLESTLTFRHCFIKLETSSKLERRILFVLQKCLLPGLELQSNLGSLLYTSDRNYDAGICRERFNEARQTQDPFICLDLRFGEMLQWKGMEDLKPEDKTLIDFAHASLEEVFNTQLFVLDRSLYPLLTQNKMDHRLLNGMKNIKESTNLHSAILLAFYYLRNNLYNEAEPYLNVINEVENLAAFKEKSVVAILLLLEMTFSRYPSKIQRKIESKIDALHDSISNVVTHLEDPVAIFFSTLYYRRKQQWDPAAELALLCHPYDKGEQILGVLKQVIEANEWEKGYTLLSKAWTQFKTPKFALLLGLCHALGKIGSKEEALPFYEQAAPEGVWLQLHWKSTHGAPVDLPEDLVAIDAKSACECLDFFEPEKKWTKQKLLKPFKEWEREVAAVAATAPGTLNSAFQAVYDARSRPLREKTVSIENLRAELNALKIELFEEQKKAELQEAQERALAQLDELQKSKEAEFEQERKRLFAVFQSARERVAAGGDSATIQREVEESFPGKEGESLKQKLKEMEQKNRELEKSLRLKEQELELERSLFDIEKQWLQEVAEPAPLLQNAELPVLEKIEQLLEGGYTESLSKIEKQFRKIKDDPTPNKMDMISLLSLLGFQQMKKQRGSHIFFAKEREEGTLYCLIWSHKSTLTPYEKRACLKRVLSALN